MPRKRTKHLSQTAYATHRGISRQAVYQAIQDGRLRDSIVLVARGGRKVRQIRSAAEADAEWEANTLDARPLATDGITAKEHREQKAAAVAAMALEDAPIQEVRRRQLLEQVRKLELQNAAAERQAKLDAGEMIRASDARADISRMLAQIKIQLRQIPTRIGQQHPGLGRDVLHDIGMVIDETLTMLVSPVR